MALGLVFTGLGGCGLYYFSRPAEGENSPRPSPAEDDLRTKLAASETANEELQERLRFAEENDEPAIETQEFVLEPVARKPAAAVPARPTPAAVKIAPPPALVEWASSSLLEDLIESSIAPEPEDSGPLNIHQRLAITGVLRNYTGGHTIAIHSVDGDSAGFEFARALKDAFAEAGWHVDGVDQVAFANPPAALLITPGTASSPEETIIPHEALATAGFDVYREVNTNSRSQKTVLLVGAALK